MGRRGRGRGRGGRGSRDRGEGKPNTWVERRPQGDEPSKELSNDAFEEYYKGQNICPPEEWDEFLASLRRHLPITFRINGSGKFAKELRTKLEADFMGHFTQGEILVGGEPVEPPHPLPWYPDGLAWQMNFSRTQLRREPVLEALHEFIKRENTVGAITRQEAVSMVPPLFMDVKPHHRVLDMCAAPGSKTFQLLEALHAGPEPATGLVIANDADTQRCNLLIHQTQRMRSPALMVTNHEAQLFPLLHDLDPESQEKRVLFDRILCDVPCSGDGTMRKQPEIWRRWSPSQGNGLHNLQLRITLRACELLRVGGRLVYSTCTFNPIEDEAVVAEVLKRTGGALQLLDVSQELPQLKRSPGLKTWKAKDRNNWYNNWDEGSKGYKLDPTMFPDAASDALPLERCMRFLPHHQDTGGFFVAVLQKVSDLESIKYPTMEHRAKRPHKQQQDKEGGEDGNQHKRRKEDGNDAAQTMDAEQPQEQQPEAGAVNKEVSAVEEVPAVQEGQAPAEALVEDTPPLAAPAATKPAPDVVVKVLPEWGIRGGGGRGRDGGKWRGLDPVVPFVDQEEIKNIREYYGLATECDSTEALISRTEDGLPKKLSIVSQGIKSFLLMDVDEKVKVVFTGLKAFERQDVRGTSLKCRYRVTQEVLPVLLPHMSRQQFRPTVEEFLAIMHDRTVALPPEYKLNIVKLPKGAAEGGNHDKGAAAVAGTEGDAPAEASEEAAAKREAASTVATTTSGDGGDNDNKEESKTNQDVHASKARVTLSDASTLEQMSAVQYGCCVATLRDEDALALGLQSDSVSEAAIAASAPLAIVCWRGNSVINVMVSRQECVHMAEKLQAAVAATGFKLNSAAAAAGGGAGGGDVAVEEAAAEANQAE